MRSSSEQRGRRPIIARRGGAVARSWVEEAGPLFESRSHRLRTSAPLQTRSSCDGPASSTHDRDGPPRHFDPGAMSGSLSMTCRHPIQGPAAGSAHDHRAAGGAGARSSRWGWGRRANGMRSWCEERGRHTIIALAAGSAHDHGARSGPAHDHRACGGAGSRSSREQRGRRTNEMRFGGGERGRHTITVRGAGRRTIIVLAAGPAHDHRAMIARRPRCERPDPISFVRRPRCSRDDREPAPPQAR